MVRLALILTAFVIAIPGQPAVAEPMAPPIEQSSEERLAHISITTVGQGRPVVLVPGLSTPRELWTATAHQLAADHEVILVQINGFGGDDPGANLEAGLLDGVVADLHVYVARRKLAPVRLIGHSMGGLVGLMLAEKHPADLSELMVVDSLPYVGDIFVPGATVAQLEPRARAMREQMLTGYGAPNTAAAKATASTMALTQPAQSRIAGWIAAADSRVAGQAMYEALTTDLGEEIRGIETPITVVFPYSNALPKVRAEAFYRAAYADAPDVAFVPVANAGHFLMLDRPEAFAAAVSDFVR